MNTNSNLTTAQIARVFAQYLGTKFKHEDPDGDKCVSKNQGAIYNPIGRIASVPTLWNGLMIYIHISDCQLLLRPLSAITDEEMQDIAKILGDDFERLGATAEDRAEFIEEFFEATPGFMIDAFAPTAYGFVSDYLRSCGVAVPLFIAPGHPDNGKTAIELGLAIDITTQP